MQATMQQLHWLCMAEQRVSSWQHATAGNCSALLQSFMVNDSVAKIHIGGSIQAWLLTYDLLLLFVCHACCLQALPAQQLRSAQRNVLSTLLPPLMKL
jgi:hypothetical protein